jgi:hypothetical protein
MFYYEGWSLEGLIDSVIQNYQDDRERYWKDDPKSAYLDLVDEIARILLQASDQLVEPERMGTGIQSLKLSTLRSLADLDVFSEQVLERMKIDVAWQFATDVRGMANRCLELTRLVLAERPNESVVKFLRRLSRAYIAGLFPESIVLCRAVLENAINEKFQTKGIPLPRTEAGKSEMKTRIEWAYKTKWLSSKGRGNALTVWDRGNVAIHRDPDAVQDSLGTIRMTMQVLGELYHK